MVVAGLGLPGLSQRGFFFVLAATLVLRQLEIRLVILAARIAVFENV